MKTSNAILVVWVLLVAGLALALVWFLKAADAPGSYEGGGGVVPLTKPEKNPKGTTPTVPKPRDRPPQAPKTPVELTGRVVDAEGKPVAGAAVLLFTPSKPNATPLPAGDEGTAEIRRVTQIVTIADEDWERIRPLNSWFEAPAADTPRAVGAQIASANSGADGTFLISLGVGASRGPYRVATRVESIGSASAANVFAGQPVELMLSSGGVVMGSVTAEGDEAAIPDARVIFDSGDREYAAVTDASGKFRIEGMPPGRFTVRAGAKGRTPILDEPVQVLRGEPVALKLPRGATLRIRTINSDGSERKGAEPPVPNAEVVVLEENSQVYVIGKSNDYGIVEFAGLPAGQWIVNGRAANFVSQGDESIEVKANQEVVEGEVAFEPAVLTPIEVVDENGSAIPGVEFFTCDGYDAYDSVRSEKLPGATDRDGRLQFPFEFDGPRCMVFGFKKGYGMVQAYPDDYSSGDPIRLVMKRSIRVYGKVLDDRGVPVPDAIVRLTFDPKEGATDAAESQTVQIHTDKAGNFDFPYVPGDFDVSLEAETEDAWSDDMPTVEQVEGKSEYEVNLRLEPNPEPRGIEMGGQHPEVPPIPKSPVK